MTYTQGHHSCCY